jgi:hypothetical protein
MGPEYTVPAEQPVEPFDAGDPLVFQQIRVP